MKKYILIPGFILATVIIGFVSCKRDFSLKDPVASTSGTSFLRIIDASPSFRKIYGLPDTFNVYINGVKITGFTPTATALMTYNSQFPAASGYGYVSVPAGLQTIALFVAGKVKPDSIPIQTFIKTFVANSFYTFMITDSIISLKDSSQIFVKDSTVQPPPGYYNLRFIHAVWNDTVGKTIDIWSTRTNRYIYTNVKPGGITTFSPFTYNPIYNDTFYVRRSDATHFGLDTLNSIGFSNQRSYTLFYKGDGTTRYISTTNIKGRHLATSVN